MTLATRSSAHVLPKYAFGKPIDQVVKTTPWLPYRLQRWVGGKLQKLLSGQPERFGLPTPNHRFLEAHPTVSSELLLRLGSGDLQAKPNVSRLDGQTVHFEDGSSDDFDAIIWATGYRISFPFFDPHFISAPNNRLPLWKRIFKPEIDDLAFIGFAQPLPTLFPFCELQSKLVGHWLAGTWAPPPAETMRRDIERDQQRFAGYYENRPRHTMQVDYYLYEHDIRRKVLPAGIKRAKQGEGPHLVGRAAAEAHLDHRAA